jgi:hypothetical protein
MTCSSHATHDQLDQLESLQEIRPATRFHQLRRHVVAHMAAGVATLVFASTLLFPMASHASNVFVRAGEITLDLLVVRPLGIGRLAFGFVCFIPTGLVASTPKDLHDNGWSSSDAAMAWDIFVGTPFHQTFRTPLGEIDD